MRCPAGSFPVSVLARTAGSLCAPIAPEEVHLSALLSVEDVAVELGTTVRFVRRLVQERRIRFHKIGKFVRIARADLEAFVSAAEVPPVM
jgi:excisionase family DNA binding protein